MKNNKILLLRKKHRRRKAYLRAISVLGCISMFFTVYALIMPALTLDRDSAAVCGLADHVHTDACYDGDTLICTVPEHTHDMDCFAPKLDVSPYDCGYEYEHTHGEGCYSDGVLVCTLAEHTHADLCLKTYEYYRRQILASDKTELSGYFSKIADACYTDKKLSEKEYSALANLIDYRIEESEAAETVQLSLNEADRATANTTAAAPVDFSDYDGETNAWQVVSGSEISTDYCTAADYQIVYSSTDESGKPVAGAKPIARIKKTVLPTGEENYFYIQLTMEPVFYHNAKDLFTDGGFILNNGSSETKGWTKTGYEWTTSDDINEVLAAIAVLDKDAQSDKVTNGNSSYLLPRSAVSGDTFSATQSTANKNQRAARYVTELHIHTDPDNLTAYETFKVDMAFGMSCQNGISVIIATKDKCKKTEASVTYTDGILEIPYPIYQQMLEANLFDFKNMYQLSEAGNTTATGVTDTMGDHVTFCEVVSCNTGKSTVSVNQGVLSWNLQGVDPYKTIDRDDWTQLHPYGSTDANDDFFAPTNGYQLIYKVKIDTTYSGFVATKGSPLVSGTVLKTNKSASVGIKYFDNQQCNAAFTSPEVRGTNYSIKFKKVDGAGNALAGANFTLKKGKDEIATFTTDATGLIEKSGLESGAYQLIETSPPEGYSAPASTVTDISLAYSPTDTKFTTSSTGFLYTGSDIVNTANGGYTLKIVLKDPYGNPLPGGIFKVADFDPLSKTDVNGTASLEDELEEETGYSVTEPTHPNGYSVPFTSLTFTLGDDGIPELSETTDYASLSYDSENEVLTLTVINIPRAKLPSTGGAGTEIFLYIGVILLLSPLFIYPIYKKYLIKR